MKMTFDYIGVPACKTGLYGQKALDVLRAWYTSSMLATADLYEVHMMKLMGADRYRAFVKDTRRGWYVFPGVGPDGEVELRTIGYQVANYHLNRQFMLKDVIRKDMNCFIAIAEQLLVSNCGWVKMKDKSVDTDHMPIVFPAEGGDVTLCLADIKCFRYLIEHSNVVTKQAERVHGKVLLEELRGARLNMLEATANKIALDAHVDELEAIKSAYWKGNKIAPEAEVEVVRERVIKAFQEIAKMTKTAEDSEQFKRTLAEALKPYPLVKRTA